jgi:hypothetical protein
MLMKEEKVRKVRMKRGLLIVIMVVMLMCFPIASFAADWNNYWVSGWQDANSGYAIYNLSPLNDRVKDQIVLLHNPGTDDWVRLEASIRSLWPVDGENFPRAWVIEGEKAFNPYAHYHYDLLNNQLILGKQYQLSPNKKWGLQYNDYYASPGIRIKSFLLKNMEQGSIDEWLTTGYSTWYYWLPDNTLMFCTYSTEEKQNVIYRFDPAAESLAKVVSGSLYAYNEKHNQILFVKNEPQRKNRVLDLSTGLQVQTDNIASFYPASETAKVPLPPEDLDLAGLKVLSPERVVQYEHEMQIGEESIPLPYVWQKGEQEFIPLRPLLQPLRINININQLADGGKLYQVLYRGKKFNLARDEYINYQWQLFVTPEVLVKMGLPEFVIKPVSLVS